MAEDENTPGNPGGVCVGTVGCSERSCDVVRESKDPIFICTASGIISLANPAFAALFGTTVDQIVGRPLTELRPAELAPVVAEQNAGVFANGLTRTFEFTAETATGTRIFWVTKGLHRTCSGSVCGVFGIVQDISERRAIEQEIIDTSDQEKQRLGRELRENFCQHLVGITLLGNALYEELSRLGIEQADDARQIAQLVKEVVTEVRTVEKGLSVTHLEQGEGLLEALEDLAEQARAVGETECLFHGPPGLGHLVMEPKTAMYLFRIAQEAVHSAIQHSGALRLHIRLADKRGATVLSVKHDGGGANARSSRLDEPSKMDFSMMNYRSRAIGAKLEIKPLRGRGLEVICTVPKRKVARRRAR